LKIFRPKYPAILKLLYPGRITSVGKKEAIYLTFDDGPVPEATPWVLDLLKRYNAKASFFCIGDNVRKHPEIFKRIITDGHCIGNHTYNHLNGWKTSNSEYIQNTWEAEKIMTGMVQEKISDSHLQTPNKGSLNPNYKLFRPPYGKIKNSQARQLKKQGFEIVMWDVISGDYDQDFSAETCYQNVIRNASAGNTIVFHDSLKAINNLKIILPKAMEYYREKGLEFRSLKDVL
jgi:peptidoglycan-N-acetylglucosamine deacetylase